MSEIDKNRITEEHNRGEQDAAKNEYHPVIGALDVLLRRANDDAIARQKAYDAGYDNGKKQRGW